MMDTQRDAKAFHELMDELCAALREGFKSTEPMRNAYWDALKDVPLAEVRFHVKRIIATASKETPFPRPRELRNHPHPMTRADDAKAEAVARASIRAWEEMRAADPIRWRIEVGIARAARALAELSPDDPGFDDWTREFQRWARVRYAERAEQERAVARYASS